VGEVPLLKELEAQYRDQGVVVVGIALDKDLKLVQEMVASKGILWAQVSDADETLQKLYNVKGTPTYYLVDRDGQIAAKNVFSLKKLSVALGELLKKGQNRAQ
jgi:peroxiredoxin